MTYIISEGLKSIKNMECSVVPLVKNSFKKVPMITNGFGIFDRIPLWGPHQGRRLGPKGKQ